jgi:tRNA threonylcarbamoyladenosine dehydratase
MKAFDQAYLDRFSGLGRLFGTEALSRLAAARVAVVGIGGVGSWTVEALARSGIGHLTLIDQDDVCVTNTNRQLPALRSTVGRAKVEVMAERVREIFPDCLVQAVPEFLTASTADRLLAPRYDWVVDAVDRRSLKALIIARSHAHGSHCVTVGSAGGKIGLEMPRITDLGRSGSDELLKQVRRCLRHDHGYEKGEHVHFGVPAVFSPEPARYPWADGTCRAEPEPGDESLHLDCRSGYGSATFVTGLFGLAAAGEVVRHLTGTSALTVA